MKDGTHDNRPGGGRGELERVMGHAADISFVTIDYVKQGSKSDFFFLICFQISTASNRTA
jgi:hypothetical protein